MIEIFHEQRIGEVVKIFVNGKVQKKNLKMQIPLDFTPMILSILKFKHL